MMNRRGVLTLALLLFAASLANEVTASERLGWTVLSFNIWNDGNSGGVAETKEVIRLVNADIIGLQEASERAEEYAQAANLHLFRQERGAILSRFEIVEKDASGLGVRLKVSPERHVWFFNVHLPASPYQPYQLHGIPYGEGNPFISTEAEAIREAKRARARQVTALVEAIGRIERSSAPVIVTGDFNEPSHLDWTEDAVAAGLAPLSVAWPASVTMSRIGLKDSFREIHRDPIIRKGYTWTPRPGKRDVPDRIDFVYQKGLKTLDSRIVGESAEHADLVVTPYPSDHRAVLTTLEFPGSSSARLDVRSE